MRNSCPFNLWYERDGEAGKFLRSPKLSNWSCPFVLIKRSRETEKDGK